MQTSPSSGSGAAKPLEDSERRANKDQPGSFDEQGADHKAVNIPPTGPRQAPIKGLDNPQDSKSKPALPGAGKALE